MLTVTASPTGHCSLTSTIFAIFLISWPIIDILMELQKF